MKINIFKFIQRIEVYRLNGLVDDHFLFVKKNQVFWLAIQTDFHEKVIKEYIGYIF
jgi:hypothetical protein